MKIIHAAEFETYWQAASSGGGDERTEALVREIIAAVRKEGDAAVRRYASRFDRSSPEQVEVPAALARESWEKLAAKDTELAAAHVRGFALEQKKQFVDFEYEMEPGLFTGQRIIPVRRAAVYVPGGRFPLISSVLMGVIPAVSAGVTQVFLASPPSEDGLPHRSILATAHLAGAHRIFALGGAQAIAALALGTETIPRADIITGPGNKYVAAAKKLLFGEVGIDFIAGPTDVLIITGPATDSQAAIAVSDMLAQAEHDPDARARVLVPDQETADRIAAALEKQTALLPAESPARASLDQGGLIIIYRDKNEAVRIANTIAPEHLELQAAEPESWIPALTNYGSLFIGRLAAEVLGDYAAGINHTLPTSGSARFTGGLSVRHFLKTVTSLRCVPGEGFEAARRAAESIARAEGLVCHAESAAARQGLLHP
jgi:histidinol dehydrogenase